MISRKKNYAVILITILIISDNVDTDDTVLNVTEKDNIFGTTTTIADISLNMIEVTPDDTALNVSEKDEDYDGSGQGREGKEEIDPEKLFYQFKVKNFQATALSNTTMFLKWTIQNATNPLDSGRILNISTVYEKDAVYFNDTRIVMSKDICHKHSDLLGDCNYTLAVEPCSNYLFRLGGSANECAASTISIEPFSIREDISEDHQNGTLLLSWNITCDSEFMKPVFVTLTQNIPNKKSVRKQEQLSALCKNRRCSTRSKKLLTTPCSNYSLQIDGIDEVHTLETAPKITELKADQMTLENKYFLRWSILPLTCPFDPRLMVARIENPSDLEPPQYNKLVLNASADQYCKNGKCQDMFEVEPCVTYRIKASNSNVPPIKVSGPKSVSELEKEYTGDLKNLIRLHWKACHNENIFSFITPIKEFNEKINRVSLSNITTVCDGSSRRCTSSLIVDNMMVRPCSQYKVEVGDSNETLYFETPPYDMTRQPKITFTFSKNQTLTISLLLSGFQSNCDKWNFTLELEIVDLSQEVKTLSCHNNGDLGRTKNCTISFPIDKLDFMCLSEYRIKSRLVYSRSDLTSKIYRGNWKETTIKPTKPSEWDGEALTELKMDYDILNQSVVIEWKSPPCLRGSTEFSTNLNIVSGSIVSDKYIVSIPPNCSKLDEIEGEISTVRKVIIDNDHIKCIDGKHILKKETPFKLVPCTSYSIQLTPMLLQDKEELPSSSVISNFSTALIPLNGIQMSSNLTASHISGYEWQFNLNFTTKENNPCGKHINSATIQIVDAREGSQNIPCTQNMTCNGVVKLNYFNMCRPLPVTIVFQYSQTEIKGHVSWFNKTLPPFVANQTSGKTFNSLTINDTNRHRFEIQWQDHICLPNGSVSSSVLEIRQWNGIAIKTFNVPHNCSYTGKSKLHRVFLEENKLACQENSTLYHIQLPPCTDYLVSLTPVVKDTNAPQVEYSQSINFTTPFDPSSIENLKTASVTSSSFELQWTIPRQCSNTSEINIEVDGEKYSSLSFGFLSRPYTECDEVKCRVTWSNPTDLSLDPCTTYNIRIGPFTNETITTLPRDNGLTIFPEKTSVTTKLRDDSHLNITLTIDELDLRCSSRLIAIDFELPDVEPPIKQNLTCKLNIFDQQASSSEVVCSQEIPIIRMDKCIPYNFTFRPVYENGLFSDEVRSVRMKLNPLLSEEEKNELHVPPEVEIYGPQTIRLYWNDPVCLMTTDVLSWEIRINNTENEYRIHLATECSSGCHLPFTNKSNPFKNSFQLDKGRISWCHHQSTSKTGSIIVSKCDLVFMPCSMYVVSVIPFVGVSNFTALEKFVETTHFNTSIDKIHPKISKITFNTLELIWTFPLRCVLLIPTDHMTTLIINKTETIEISFSNLSSSKCDEMTCLMNWKSPSLLSACTEYLISIDLVDQKIFTVPNSSDHSACGFSDNSETKLSRQEFSTDSNVAEDKLVLLGWIIGIGLGFLGLTLVFVTIGILFGIFKKTITLRETGRYDISKKNSTSMNSTKATKENVTRINGAVN